jgi:hypothetical protein
MYGRMKRICREIIWNTMRKKQITLNRCSQDYCNWNKFIYQINLKKNAILLTIKTKNKSHIVKISDGNMLPMLE